MNIIQTIENLFNIKEFNEYKKDNYNLPLVTIMNNYMYMKFKTINLSISASNNIGTVKSKKDNFLMTLYFKNGNLQEFIITKLVKESNSPLLTTTDIGDSLVAIDNPNEEIDLIKAKLESIGLSKEQIVKFLNNEERKEVLPKTDFRKLEVFEKIGINSQLLYNKMYQYRAFIAGSFVLSLKMEDPSLYSDIDFFIYETDNYNFLANWFKSMGFQHKSNEYHPTYRAMSIKDKLSMEKDGVKIDLVCLNENAFENPINYVSKWFDINICMYVLNHKGNLLTTSYNHYYYNKIKNKECAYVKTWYKGTAFRVVKYTKKGYVFNTNTLVRADVETNGKLDLLNDSSIRTSIEKLIKHKYNSKKF